MPSPRKRIRIPAEPNSISLTDVRDSKDIIIAQYFEYKESDREFSRRMQEYTHETQKAAKESSAAQLAYIAEKLVETPTKGPQNHRKRHALLAGEFCIFPLHFIIII